MHICGIDKSGADEPVCRAGIETQRMNSILHQGIE